MIGRKLKRLKPVDFLSEVGVQVVDFHAALLGGVPLAHRDRVVLQGVEVHRDAEGGPRLVHAPVPPTDRARRVPDDVVAFLELGEDAAGLVDELGLVLHQWEDRHLDGRHGGVKLEHGALLPADLVLAVGAREQGQEEPVHPRRGLDHVGHVLFFGLLVKIVEVLARGLLVGGQVEASAGGDPEEFLLAKGEGEGHVCARPRVVRQLVRGVHLLPHEVLAEADPPQPALHVLDPQLVLRGPHLVAGLDEVLDLHLLELARAEDEVARGDLVPEGLAHLRDPEGDLLPRDFADVFEVDEDSLGGLGAEKSRRGRTLQGTHLGLEHEVEVPGRRQVPGLPRRGRGDQRQLQSRGLDQLLDDEGLEVSLGFGLLLHLPRRLLEHALRVELRLLHAKVADGLVGALDLNFGEQKLIRPVPELGALAVDHGVAEAGDVARGLPDGGGGDD
mmetsp:Transcript_67331/g.152348  ORF Transcript_67331/g.152348 Transcript_67331/m.152348 type:complete len:445 (+) Transcript_67331:318-1652(+)